MAFGTKQLCCFISFFSLNYQPCRTIVPLPSFLQMVTCFKSNTPWKLCEEEVQPLVSKARIALFSQSNAELLPSE